MTTILWVSVHSEGDFELFEDWSLDYPELEIRYFATAMEPDVLLVATEDDIVAAKIMLLFDAIIAPLDD